MQSCQQAVRSAGLPVWKKITHTQPRSSGDQTMGLVRRVALLGRTYPACARAHTDMDWAAL